MSKDAKDKSTPMDPSIREVVNGAAARNNERACWAAKTLVAEVQELFPETPVEYSNRDGRNTALDVSFDLSVLDTDDNQMLVSLLTLVPTDKRIREVMADPGTQQVLVSFHSNPRTQDSIAAFGLGDALDVLDEDDQ